MYYFYYYNNQYSIHVALTDPDNAVFLLAKHKFCAAKWQSLAVCLRQTSAVARIEADGLHTLITHWMENDPQPSWRTLIDAVTRSGQNEVANALAKELGMSCQGAVPFDDSNQ